MPGRVVSSDAELEANKALPVVGREYQTRRIWGGTRLCASVPFPSVIIKTLPRAGNRAGRELEAGRLNLCRGRADRRSHRRPTGGDRAALGRFVFRGRKLVLNRVCAWRCVVRSAFAETGAGARPPENNRFV